MPQKQIYLNQELYEASKEISNFSELVARLFKDFLSIKKSKSELIKEAETIKKEREEIINEQNKELTRIELEVKKVETIEEETKEREEQRQHKLANKISDCINNTKEIFGIELNQEEAEEYIKGNSKNIKEYLINKGKWK